MPLDWSHAYGGRDREAERLGRPDREALLRETRPIQASDVEAIATASYPRNRAGRGFYLDVERARLDGAPLFNLMDPDASNRPEDLLAKSLDDWVARPPAAGYGPVDWLSFPRTFFMGMSTTPLPASCDELRQGALMPNDLVAPPRFPVGDARMHQCAVPGLGSRRLQGSESFALTNLSADAPLLRGTLPRQRPQLLLEPHGTRVFELEPKLSTVLFEPDKRRVTMTWTGVLPVAAPYHPQQCEEMRHAAVWK
jgi:hypothetical protein